MKIVIEKIGDNVGVSFIGKGKRTDRLMLLAVAMIETFVDSLIPDLTDEQLQTAASEFANEVKAAAVALRIDRSQYGDLIHWLDFHRKGKNPPPALYALEMLLKHLEYLRGGRHYLYNSIYEITCLEDAL